MKEDQILNPSIFVRDENDPKFRAHILQRAEEAKSSKNRLPLSELKKRLSKYRRNPVNA